MLEAEWPHDHSATGRIKSMKNPNDTIGNRNRDIPFRRAVPQPTAPPRTPTYSTATWVFLNYPEFVYIAVLDLHTLVLRNSIHEAEF
jgi:hypothetical protein